MIINRIFDLRLYILSMLAVVSFSQFVVQLFGQTIPNVIWTFFKDAGEAVVLASVFLFALAWLVKARPHTRPKNYSIVVFDVFGKETTMDGIRTEFKNHDVAWSYMKQYKNFFPMNNFAMVSDIPKSKKKNNFQIHLISYQKVLIPFCSQKRLNEFIDR